MKLFGGLSCFLIYSAIGLLACLPLRATGGIAGPVVTSNGTVILEISEPVEVGEGEGDLQFYSIQVSDDLENWTEIARDRLNEVLEVRDYDSVEDLSRFYRVVPVELEEAIRLFAIEIVDDLDELDSFASGIVLDGITLEDYKALQVEIDALRNKLEVFNEMGEPFPEALQFIFQERMAEVDEMLASNPLHLVYAGATYEINVSEAMRVLSGEYKRLGLVSLDDYDRLPGIDAADIDGLESLAEYLAKRQIGIRTNIPVFAALSPYGNFELTRRLVLKHLDILSEEIADDDSDGVFEIDYKLYGRLLNGAERASRESERLVATISSQYPISWAVVQVQPVSNNSLAIALGEFDEQNSEIEERLLDNVIEKEYEKVFEEQILAETRSRIRNVYSSNISRLENAIRNPGISMELIRAFSGSIPQSPSTPTKLAAFLSDLEVWQTDIVSSVNQFIEKEDFSEQLASSLRNILLAKLNGYWASSTRVKGVYEQTFEQFETVVRSGSVVFNINGLGSVLVDAEDYAQLESLPNSIDSLLALSGIANSLTEEELAAMQSDARWNALRTVSFEEKSNGATRNLSMYAKRIQLVSALLKEFGSSVLSNGSFDPQALKRLALLDSQLESYVDAAIRRVNVALAEIDDLRLDTTQGISSNEYKSLLNILIAAKEEISLYNIESNNSLPWSTRSLFGSLLEDAYNQLVQRVGSYVSTSYVSPGSNKVRIEIGGVSYGLSVAQLRDVFRKSALRVSVVYKYRELLTRRQYSRLNGINEELVLGLSEFGSWENLKKLNYGTALPIYENGVVSDISTRNINGLIDSSELYYQLYPKVLQRFGHSIINADNVIDLALVEENLLSGIVAPVGVNQSIEGVHDQIVLDEAQKVLPELIALNYSRWKNWERSESLIVDLKRGIVSRVAKLLPQLIQPEIEQLQGNAVQSYQGSGYRAAYIVYSNRLNYKSVTAEVDDGSILSVPVEALTEISNFPNRPNDRNAELFPGLEESDYENANELVYQIVYTNDGELADEHLYESYYSRQKIAMRAIERLYKNRSEIPDLYRDQLFANDSVNIEIFRRFIKGIDQFHRKALADAEIKVEEALAVIRKLRKSPMTVEAINNIYSATVDLNAELKAHLEELTNWHERQDVIEIEEDVSFVYKASIDLLIDYLRSNKLVVLVEGASVEIPILEISKKMLDHLKSRYPGEDIAAHHYASFLGISIESLKGYNMLEDFFGNQIIALPRNSDYVEVDSKLSEIGMMQLVSDVVTRFSNEVIHSDTGAVDVERLIELLSDEDNAFDHVISRVDALFQEGIANLRLVDNPTSLEGLERVSSVFAYTKILIVNTLNDLVSVFSEERFAAVQERVDQHYQELLAARGELVFNKTISIDTIDGTNVSVNISNLEDELVSRIAELVEKYKLLADASSSFGGGDILIFDNSWSIEPIRYPNPVQFDADDTLTRFGFHLLVARLIEKFGAGTTDEGEFSIDEFVAQLELTDSERVEGIFERLAVIELRQLEEILPVDSSPITIDAVSTIQSFLRESRSRFVHAQSSLYEPWGFGYGVDMGIAGYARSGWLKVVERYEAALQSRDVSLNVDGKVVTLPVATLARIMDESYVDGFTTLLDSYLEGGESVFEYEAFRTIWDYYPFDLYSNSGNQAQRSSLFEDTTIVPRYPFNLGDLLKLPGVSPQNIEQLDVESKDRIALTKIAPNTLIRGRLNLRVFAPGSVLQTVGESSSLTADFVDAENYYSVDYREYYRIPATSYLDLSWRDIQFRLLVQLVLDYKEQLISAEGNFDIEAFRNLFEEIAE